jgi:hypothetical protein
MVSLMGAKMGGAIEKQQEYTVIPARTSVELTCHSACICGIAGTKTLPVLELLLVAKVGERYMLNWSTANSMLRYHFLSFLQLLGSSLGSTVIVSAVDPRSGILRNEVESICRKRGESRPYRHRFLYEFPFEFSSD